MKLHQGKVVEDKMTKQKKDSLTEYQKDKIWALGVGLPLTAVGSAFVVSKIHQATEYLASNDLFSFARPFLDDTTGLDLLVEYGIPTLAATLFTVATFKLYNASQQVFRIEDASSDHSDRMRRYFDESTKSLDDFPIHSQGYDYEAARERYHELQRRKTLSAPPGELEDKVEHN